MSVILFWLDEHTLRFFWDPAPADQVVEAINAGRSSLDPGWIPGSRWKAISQGELVFATPAPGEPVRLPHLTPRERDVLAGLAEGLSTKEIARRLQLQPRTVDEYTWTIRDKLGAQNRADTVGQAVRMGLVRDSRPKRRRR